MYLLVALIALCYFVVNASYGNSYFTQHGKTDKWINHKVLIAVNQNGGDRLKSEVLSRTSSNSRKFHKWLSFEEVCNFAIMLD